MTVNDASRSLSDVVASVSAKVESLLADNAALKASLAGHESGEGELPADQAAALQASIDRLKTLAD